jgi:hypothetical protein
MATGEDGQTAVDRYVPGTGIAMPIIRSEIVQSEIPFA